jgi:hypothetical protein
MEEVVGSIPTRSTNSSTSYTGRVLDPFFTLAASDNTQLDSDTVIAGVTVTRIILP